MSTTMDQRPPTHQRTRSRGFSFKSDKSGNSLKAGKPKVDNLHETAQDKMRTHMSKDGKADPNAAMNEAQPIADALAEPTLGNLRMVQHVDSEGNPIAEPDLSNPTRPRWERPLDTIRSFDRAIEAEYKRKHSISRGESFNDGQTNGYASRRSSYYGGGGGGYENPRYSQVGGYYGSRNRDSFAEYGQSPMAGPTRNRFSQRMHSEPQVPRGYNGPYGYNNHGPVYPHNGYQQSRDTVNTGVSSGSHSDPYSTDPSSENSSVDRVNATQQKPMPDPSEQYGFSGFGGAPIYEDGEMGYNVVSPPSQHRPTGSIPNGGYFPQNGIYQRGPPPVPSHGGPSSAQRGAPIKLGAGSSVPSAPLTQTSGNNGIRTPAINRSESKRKSWFKRRFSKD